MAACLICDVLARVAYYNAEVSAGLGVRLGREMEPWHPTWKRSGCHCFDN
jgi:hypothetical protein